MSERGKTSKRKKGKGVCEMNYSRQIHYTGKVTVVRDEGQRAKPSKKLVDETIAICLSCEKEKCRGCTRMKRHIVKRKEGDE